MSQLVPEKACYVSSVMLNSTYSLTHCQGWKRWFFKVLFFMVFKNLERSDFLVFMVFLDIVFFV